MLRSILVAIIAAVCLAMTGAVWAEDQEAPQNGTIYGILTAKGADWIEVKADGAKESVRYLPYWRGGMPKDGGGFDQAMLKTIKSLIVPNRVKLVWEFQEHRRIVSVEMLAPEKKDGTLIGKVTAKGDAWVEVTPEKEPPVRFWPRWIGGMPKDGGGLDKDMLAAIRGVNIGDTVEVKWMYDERLRAVTLQKVTPPPAEEPK